MMTPGYLPLQLAANVDFVCAFALRGGGAHIDMTGWTLRGQWRVQPGQAGAALAAITFVAGPVDLATGYFEARTDQAVLEPLRPPPGFAPRRIYYDILADLPAGETVCLFQGPADLFAGVTR